MIRHIYPLHTPSRNVRVGQLLCVGFLMTVERSLAQFKLHIIREQFNVATKNSLIDEKKTFLLIACVKKTVVLFMATKLVIRVYVNTNISHA